MATNFGYLHISEYSNLVTPVLNVWLLNIVVDSDTFRNYNLILKNLLKIKYDPSSYIYLYIFNINSSFNDSLQIRKKLNNELSCQNNTNLNPIARDD